MSNPQAQALLSPGASDRSPTPSSTPVFSQSQYAFETEASLSPSHTDTESGESHRRRHWLGPTDTLRMRLMQQIEGARKWDWNVILAYFVAFFFFALYMTSPAAKFISQHATCPVEVPIVDLSAPIPTHHAPTTATAFIVGSSSPESHHSANTKSAHASKRATDHDSGADEAPYAGERQAVEASILPASPSAPLATTTSSRSDSSSSSYWTSGKAHPIIMHSADMKFQKTSHIHSGIQKQVHLTAKAGVTHLLQWAQSSFEQGDATERHKHDTATEIFFVKSGILTVYFDVRSKDELNELDHLSHSNSTSASAATTSASSHNQYPRLESTPEGDFVVHQLMAGDSVTIPPKAWHKLANTHKETLWLVYATLEAP